MWRGVEEAVGRHDAVETRAADPVVDEPLLTLDVDELRPGSRGEQEVIGRLAAITAVVEPVGVDVRREAVEYFAALQSRDR